MDKDTLIERATAALEQLGLEVKVLPIKEARRIGPGVDAHIRIGKGKDQIEFLVEAKRAVGPTTLGAAVAQLRDLATTTGRHTLLITDYLTPPAAEKLRALRQQFADTVGNAYLEAPGLLIYVTGRKHPDMRGIAKGGGRFTNNGLKVLFALICDPPLAEAPHRAIARAAGVALGAVPGVLADLHQTGDLLVGRKRRRLNATKRLLDEWALAYARRLRAKTLQATYETPKFDQWREWQLDPAQARWGGEPAANLLVRHLKPGVLTIYAEKLPPKLLVDQRMAVAGHPRVERYLELRRPFWGKTLHGDERHDTVAPALVYADLLATGDGRCVETAQMIYDRHLARLLPAQ